MKKLIPLLLTIVVAVVAFTLWFFPAGQSTEQLAPAWENTRSFPDKFARLQYEIRTAVGDEGPRYEAGYRIREHDRAVALKKGSSLARPWTSRGPGNVGGRTRGLIVDPDDASFSTWYAGAVSGGVWKTVDAGQSWSNLTPDLPNLAISCMTMAASDHDLIFAGTGEGFNNLDAVAGDGIFKSTDRGTTWTQIPSTAGNSDFRLVNRIIVDPTDADLLIVGTNTGIFRSTNGGSSFTKVWSGGQAQSIVANPQDFNIQFAGVNQLGIYRSTDRGVTWNRVFFPGGSRIELAVSTADPNWIYGGVETDGSMLVVSSDGGETWEKIADAAVEPNWFTSGAGNQGWYDNTIVGDPFDPKRVFVGGIDVWRIDLLDGQRTENRVVGMDVSEVESFLDMVPFQGNYLTGLDIGTNSGAVNLEESDFVSVEIRWGPGRSQKAHRFTVPFGSTSGVPASQYIYQDYIDVPFEVWDVTNNRQLMASFRDNDGNGSYNLIGDIDTGREYLFVNAIPYDANNPSSAMERAGGHTEKMLYQLWYILDSNATWDPNSFPTSAIKIEYGEQVVRTSQSQQLTFTNGMRVLGVHPDQHALIVHNVNQAAQTFSILNASDGGVSLSTNNGSNFTYLVGGYVTTQFYGVDKKPGEDVYVGGTQDNGTLVSPVNPTASSAWIDKLGGDGAEALWHETDPTLVLGSHPNDGISKSTDGGNFFSPATTGLTDVGANAPFVTRLAKSRIDPDLVFTTGLSGVWRSDDFADTWTLSPVDRQNWSLTSIMDVAVSEANPQIVWAGSFVRGGGKIHLSTDGGVTFHPIDVEAPNPGRITSIATHPVDENTAYILFSQTDSPKILRTTNLGATWEDISGFSVGKAESDNGFPDVATYSLLVMPYNTDEIWVGTEIGLFISEDDGATWAFADDGLPAVSIWDMKIVDDEVVVATHGRGIWTVEIPDLLTAPPPDIPVAPRLKQAFFNPIGALAMELDLRAAFDSVQIRANGDPVGASGPTVPGDTTIQVPFSTVGTFDIQAAAFKDGKPFFSPLATIAASAVPPKRWSYENGFTSLSAAQDFAGSGFNVNRINQWLATSSPYPLNTELTFTLSIPIVVSNVISKMTWTDVALVQPGLPGFDYTQPGFRDYVIVEATRDGLTWLPLVDGYDARYDSRWLSLYSSGQAPGQELFVEHEIDLRDTFSAGEIIFIRFRLHSDDNATGWGWAIGNLSIQPGAPVANANDSEPELPEDFALHANYPNPFNPSTNISFSLPQRADVTLRIFDLNGRLVQTLVRGGFEAGTHTVRWDASQVASGTYIYRLSAGDFVQSRKMLLIR